MEILIRSDEACQPDPFLLWDSIFDQEAGIADFVLAGNAPLNSGGLQAEAALETGVVLCLFTDAQLPSNHPLAYLVSDGDFRGWWGDGIDVRADLGETVLGSFLWVLKRAPLTSRTAFWAQSFALQALAPLQTQGAVVTINAVATIANRNTLLLAIEMFGRDGSKVYDRAFDIIWSQLQASA